MSSACLLLLLVACFPSLPIIGQRHIFPQVGGPLLQLLPVQLCINGRALACFPHNVPQGQSSVSRLPFNSQKSNNERICNIFIFNSHD